MNEHEPNDHACGARITQNIFDIAANCLNDNFILIKINAGAKVCQRMCWLSAPFILLFLAAYFWFAPLYCFSNCVHGWELWGGREVEANMTDYVASDVRTNAFLLHGFCFRRATTRIHKQHSFINNILHFRVYIIRALLLLLLLILNKIRTWNRYIGDSTSACKVLFISVAVNRSSAINNTMRRNGRTAALDSVCVYAEHVCLFNLVIWVNVIVCWPSGFTLCV